MKTLSVIWILIFIVFASNSAFARVVCKIERINQAIIIDSEEVSFYSYDDMAVGREIASVLPSRTSRTATGFSKIVKFDNLEYKIMIPNTANFSEVEDQISIKNDKGHEIIYPLSCK